MNSTLPKELVNAYEELNAYLKHETAIGEMDFEKIIAEDVMGYGTTKMEVMKNLNDLKKNFKSQAKQASEIQSHFEIRSVYRKYLESEGLAIFVDEIDASFKINGQKMEMEVRNTMILQLIEGSWKLINFHTSVPNDTGNDHWHVNEWQKEKEKLEKQVTEQTADLIKKNRELEIEAAVERVRSHTMGMQNPDDIRKVLTVMRDEINKFELGNIGTWLWMIDENEQVKQWNISELTEEGDRADFNTPIDLKKNTEANKILHSWRNGKAYHVHRWSGKSFDKLLKDISRTNDDKTVRMFRKAVKNSKSKEYYQFAASYSKGIIGLGFIQEPPEKVVPILTKMADAFGMAYQRFEDLQRVEERARETQIELSLERIRAQVTAMQESSDLFDIVVSMREEFISLGHKADYFWHMRWLSESYEMSMTSEDGNRIGMVISIPKFVHEGIPGLREWEEGNDPIFVLALNGNEAWDYIDNMNTHGHYEQADPNSPAKDEIVSIGGLTFVIARTSHGEIGFSLPGVVHNPPQEALDTLVRFAGVFDMAYKRFEDLKDAEQRARETQIELSLERIRARVSAMHESSELLDIVVTMRSEFVSLGYEAHYFWYMRWLPELYEKAMTSGDGSKIGMVMTLPRHIHGDIPSLAEWEKGVDPTMVLAMDTEMACDYVEKMITLGDFEQVDPQAPTLDDIRHIGGLTFIMARTSTGEIGYSLPGVVPDPPLESVHTLVRFAGVFDLAYKRFEDLQNAEKRAREAQIETAIERVRSRAMAMHSSAELKEVAMELRAQMRKLGQKDLEVCAIHLYEEHEDYFESWGAMRLPEDDGEIVQIQTLFPNSGITIVDELMSHYESDLEDYVLLNEGKKAQEWFELLKKYSPEAYLAISPLIERTPLDEVKAYWAISEFTGGALVMVTYAYPEKDSFALLNKAANVFDLAYKRFVDLRQAERQTYESRVEASLERVRGMAAAMNHSDDLKQIAEAMFKEMEILQINPLRYGLGMIDGVRKEAELWASTVDDGQYLEMLGTLSLTWHPMLQQCLNAWEAQHEELVYRLEGKELSDYYLRIGAVNPDIPDLKSLQDPNTDIVQYCSFFPFKSGSLYAFTHGEPDEDGKSILKRFANVFEQAHIRFHDLQKTELQARMIRDEKERLEITLRELNETQDQLIQQEKLASLGQLTAGIAHEIKNPLNFVNNFSDLSMELIDEALEELKEFPSASEEITGLLSDISSNLKKIHEHGSRADNIVKSMLQHSRGGSGKTEPTELNSFVKEYVNLSFHGMRAGKNPINVDISFEMDDSIQEVPLIAEDFSRVIVNLCNNAFDAMKEKLKSSGDYKAKLTIRTRKEDSYTLIEIEDNGQGIPEDLKDKILQPFFTTKKGKEGTGLGLSITNDIIKAHGGILNIDSKEGQFSIFRIKISEKGTI